MSDSDENENGGSWHVVCPAEKVGDERGTPAEVNEIRLAILRHQGKLYALDEMCTHAEASLAFGILEDGCVACPWHYAQFDLETGEPKSLPAVTGVKTYLVRETDDGNIEVQV